MIRTATTTRMLSEGPTLWGLGPIELHNRFWATRGVQVIRLGQRTETIRGAELFLLMDSDLLAIFRLSILVETLSWLRPDVLWVRLKHRSNPLYRERIVAEEDGSFVRFERMYGEADAPPARVALTSDREIARCWQSASDKSLAWRELRRQIPRERRTSAQVQGRTYDMRSDDQAMGFITDLMESWEHPSVTIGSLRKIGRGVWAHNSATVAAGAEFIGSAWIGAGRTCTENQPVLGPAVLWDDPLQRPAIDDVEWEELEPSQGPQRPRFSSTSRRRYTIYKRLFDLCFASCALLFLLPLFPLVMLAIFLEDGRPFFFVHRRETRGGRSFKCLKFRSMYKDADKIKASLVRRNQVDGPQFYMKDDPRTTRVGRVLRKYYIDELPQLFNVLAGDMSIVGPRPSPFKENQYCPPWREERLSVLPGITGLWQVMRTREEGKDFQEWIKYDLQYVQRMSLWLDLEIVVKTVRACIRQIRG